MYEQLRVCFVVLHSPARLSSRAEEVRDRHPRGERKAGDGLHGHDSLHTLLAAQLLSSARRNPSIQVRGTARARKDEKRRVLLQLQNSPKEGGRETWIVPAGPAPSHSNTSQHLIVGAVR